MKKDNKKDNFTNTITEKQQLKKEFKIMLTFIGISLLIIITIYIIKFGIPNLNIKKKDKLNQDNEIFEFKEIPNNIEYKTINENIKFNCEKYNNNINNYDKGDKVYCYINLNLKNDITGIREMWSELSYDENIEYINTEKKDYSPISLVMNNNKIYLKDKNIESPDRIQTYPFEFEFKIKATTKKEKLNIYLKNIIFKTEDNVYYKIDDYVTDLIINTPTNYQFNKNEETNELIFYKFNNNEGYEEINRYKCQNEECDMLDNYKLNHIDLDNGKAIMYDGKENYNQINYYKKIMYYNFNYGIIKTIENIYHPIATNSYDPNNEHLENFYIFENLNNEMAIIDINGNYIKEFSNKKYTLNCYEGCFLDNYSVKADIIVTYNDDGYGIDKLNKNEEIIEHKFEDIKLNEGITVEYRDNNDRIYNYVTDLYNENKYFKAKENDKWYLYSYETKEKITKTGYDELFVIDKNLILTIENNIISIKDFNNNNLTDNTIKLEHGLRPWMPKNPDGIKITIKENIVTIGITDGPKDSYDWKSYTYEYNINTKELTKKDLEQ